MRKSLLATIVLTVTVVLTAAAVTVAGGGDGATESVRSAKAPAAPAVGEPAFVRAATRDGRSQAAHPRTRALKHGHGHGHGHAAKALRSLAERLDVTPQQLRAAIRTVKRDGGIDHTDLAGTKDRLAAGLATELGKTSEEIVTAVRTELEAQLDRGVKLGWVTEQGRKLALGCFDTPAECDLRALRWEIGLGAFRHHRR